MKYFCLLVLLFLTSCSRRMQQEARVPFSHVEKRSMTIILDPGHGGESMGTKMKKAPYLVEKELALACSFKVRDCLEQWGYKVRMTRTRDVAVPLLKRVALAKEWRGQLFVSIHFNHAANVHAQGVEVFYYPDSVQAKRSKHLAHCLLKSIVQKTKAASRGVKEGNFCVIRENSLPAVLIEGGFFSNAAEAKKLATDKYFNALAYSIAKGIDDFVRQE